MDSCTDLLFILLRVIYLYPLLSSLAGDGGREGWNASVGMHACGILRQVHETLASSHVAVPPMLLSIVI